MKARLLALLVFGTAVSCTTRTSGEIDSSNAGVRYDSTATVAAIDRATARMREHGQGGFGAADLKRTRDWFTPELFELLLRDLDGPDGPGYLNWDPFTDAQDDVGPARYEDVRLVGDTVMVRFSREGYQQKRDSVTLAMRRVDTSWRIANFIYSGHTRCYRDLAANLVPRHPETGC